MATLEIPSNVKCITSGQVPTTVNLKDGEFAFGKVGGVAKLYGNVNGVIIDFTGDDGDIPSNINTFTEVNNALTLTESDTIHNLGNKIVALGQSVIRVKPSDTARAQVDRIMGSPSTGGPPPKYCDYWFKVLSERLIYVFFGYSGQWGMVNYLYNASQSSEIAWGKSPYWMPISPNQIVESVPDPLNVSEIKVGTLGDANNRASYIDITSSGIEYYLGTTNFSHGLFFDGPIGNVKTFFGNQSIYGTGNVDLYKHTLEIKVGGNSIFTTFYSSNNLSIDSLVDWKTVAGNEFSFPAWGMYNGQAVRDVTQGGFDSLTSTFANNFVLWTSISFTIIDTVATV